MILSPSLRRQQWPAVLAGVLAVAAGGCGGGAGGGAPVAPSSVELSVERTSNALVAPARSTPADARRTELEVAGGDEVGLELAAHDRDGDPVSIRLLTPQPGLEFSLPGGTSQEARAVVVWRVPAGASGLRQLVFEAYDASGETMRHVVAARIVPGGGP